MTDAVGGVSVRGTMGRGAIPLSEHEILTKICQAGRLIVLDMDGTTIRRNQTMSEVNKEWLLRAREAGMEFTFATGRHRLGMVETLVRDLGIVTPVVTVNGSEVWTAGGELLQRRTFAKDDIRVLYEISQRYETHHWASTIEGPVPVGQFPELSRVGEYTWLKFGFWSSEASVIAELWAVLAETERFELSNSDPSNIEINPKGVSKASGLQVVCEHTGILPEQVIAFGDSLNDVAMFRFAGCSVAMGNAQEQVRDAASFVTLDCEDDGVAVFLRRLLASR